MWLGFDSHMWVEFVAGSVLVLMFFFSPGLPVFPPFSKTNISKLQFDVESEGHRFVSHNTLVKQSRFIYFYRHMWVEFTNSNSIRTRWISTTNIPIYLYSHFIYWSGIHYIRLRSLTGVEIAHSGLFVRMKLQDFEPASYAVKGTSRERLLTF